MDDVLPKPFTRKSLLEMLEKHLLHLKKLSPEMQPPPSATAPPMHHSSAAHSVKDDNSSPGQSPAGSIGNWNSPGGPSYGVSPLHTQLQGPPHYMPVQNTGGYAMDQHSLQYSPTTPVHPARPPHRRHVSEMSGASNVSMGDIKRQRLGPGYPNGMVSPLTGQPR